MLNEVQKKVVFKMPFNTIVSASPGTGKTKTIVARAQHKLNSLPKHKYLALITYTNAGADEIESRLITNNDNIFIGTIHRFCLQYILRPFGWLYNYDPPKVVSFEDLNEFIEDNKEIDLGDSPIDELNKIKKDRQGVVDNNIEWQHNIPLDTVADLYYEFLESKKLIDFNEILYRSYRIVLENKFVADSLSNKFYEISVDEFQDTNIFQYEILRILNQCGNTTFFMVGDEKQRIYGFAGAIEDAFKKASKDFSASIEILEITYRSSSNVIDAYSKLFDCHPKLVNDSKYKDINLPLTFTQTDNNSNAPYIEFCIDKLIENNIELEEIAVLTTTWMEAFNISRSLRQKYQTVGLGALPHKTMNNSTFSLLRSLCKYYYLPSITKLRSIRRYIELHVLENNISMTAKELVVATNLLITMFNKQDFQSTISYALIDLKNLFDKVFCINHTAFDQLKDLISEEEGRVWNLEKYAKTLSGISGITINTIHQSKGLEYSAVILNNINKGRIPYQEWDRQNRVHLQVTEENLNSGRTLFYVGISRAKYVLIITHSWNPSLFVNLIK